SLRFAFRPLNGRRLPVRRNPPIESSVKCLYAFSRKVNCSQSRRGRFWSPCDISATNLAYVGRAARATFPGQKSTLDQSVSLILTGRTEAPCRGRRRDRGRLATKSCLPNI